MNRAPVMTANPRPAVFQVQAIDEAGTHRDIAIAGEHALTVYLDKRELITLMTLGAAPEHLVLGYLRNQRIVRELADIAAIQVDWETATAAVTSRSLAEHGISCWDAAGLNSRLKKRTVTTGCGQGTMFGDVMSEIDSIRLNSNARLSQATLYHVLDQVRRYESIYQQAGAVHGCALCANPQSMYANPQSPLANAAIGERAGDILYFVEDVGRHNAVDAIAGWMWTQGISADDKIFYTTGRLTSEMVIKCAQMRVPVLLSRSGLTQMGHELAARLDMTLIGRCQGKHYLLFTGNERFVCEPGANEPHATAPVQAPRSALQVTGLVLAGGLGRRMSSDGLGVNKGLQRFQQQTLIEHVIKRLAPQVATLIINANQQAELFEPFGFPVVGDELPGFLGPLAGLHAGLKACRTEWLLCVPCDSPFLPEDLLARMFAAMPSRAPAICVASNRGHWQPVFALVRANLVDNLQHYLQSGERKIDRWFMQHQALAVEFDDDRAFLNFNTPDELERHEL